MRIAAAFAAFAAGFHHRQTLRHEPAVNFAAILEHPRPRRFGPMFAAEIRKRLIQTQSYSRWRWHLDEVFVRINGETHYLYGRLSHCKSTLN